jgi:hypothetical protein
VSLLLATLLALACPQAPLPEGDALVRGLVGTQRRNEDALSLYAYDVLETREALDGRGRATRRETRGYEVFHVKGRAVRRLVSRDGRALPPREREKEDARARELAQALREGSAASEQPGVRLSRVLERYRFRALGREQAQGRCVLALEFEPRPGEYALERDALLRRLAGRLWVDEEERAVVRVSARNTQGLSLALGIGARVSGVALDVEFARLEEGVWLPRRVSAEATGRRLLLFPFRARVTSDYRDYRRFEVSIEEERKP